MDKTIKGLIVLITIVVLLLAGYEVYQTHMINSLSDIPAENQRILMGRTALLKEIKDIEANNLDIRNQNKKVLSDLINKIDELQVKIDAVYQIHQLGKKN